MLTKDKQLEFDFVDMSKTAYIPYEILLDKRLNLSHLRVYCLLKDYPDFLWTSERMNSMFGFSSKNHIDRLIRKLERFGYVQRHKRGRNRIVEVLK